jgi:hypothetical protein
MPLGRLGVAAAVALWLLIPLLLSASCLAQGPATPWEIRGAEAAAEMIGASPLVRGALERLLGPSAAQAVLGLPAKELGWKVIETDVYASAVATSPALRQAGNADAFLASINDLRAFRAQTVPTRSSFDFLSVNNSSHNPLAMIRPVTVENPSDLTKWEFTFTREGMNIDPGYTIPLWNSRSTIGNMKLDQIKWSDVAVACAIVSPCANGISNRLKEIVGTSSPTDAWSLNNQADAAYRRKDYAAAARFYRLSADQGNAYGQASLGFLYEHGLGGLPQDEAEAARLYRLAADQGDAWAQSELAGLQPQAR